MSRIVGGDGRTAVTTLKTQNLREVRPILEPAARTHHPPQLRSEHPRLSASTRVFGSKSLKSRHVSVVVALFCFVLFCWLILTQGHFSIDF